MTQFILGLTQRFKSSLWSRNCFSVSQEDLQDFSSLKTLVSAPSMAVGNFPVMIDEFSYLDEWCCFADWPAKQSHKKNITKTQELISCCMHALNKTKNNIDVSSCGNPLKQNALRPPYRWDHFEGDSEQRQWFGSKHLDFKVQEQWLLHIPEGEGLLSVHHWRLIWSSFCIMDHFYLSETNVKQGEAEGGQRERKWLATRRKHDRC